MGNHLAKLDKITHEDKILSRTIGVYYLVNTLNVAIKTAFPNMSQEWWSLMRYGVIAVLSVCILRSIGIIVKRAATKLVILEVIFCFLYIISFVQGNADNSLLRSSMYVTLGLCVPLVLCVIAIRDKSILYKTMAQYSYVILASSLIALVSLGRVSNYSMSLTSYILLFVLIRYNELILNKGFWNLVFAIYGVAFILIYGNRAAVLGMGFYIVLNLIWGNIFSAKKLVLVVLLAIGSIIFVLNFENIVRTAYAVLQKYGYRSYIIESLIYGVFFQSDSRTGFLFPHYWELIRQKPWFGWGIYGGYISEGLGPHNLMLEYLLAFGWPFGIILCCWFIGSYIKTFIAMSKEKNNEVALLMIFCSSCVYMFISGGGWLTNLQWFIYMALCWGTSSRYCKQDIQMTGKHCK